LNPFRSKKIRLAVNKDTADRIAALSRLVASGDVKPVVDSCFALEDAAIGHAKAESRHRRGSIILDVA
jgi:NADPH:quinone reductase-like Zn-dependent oxidoreductase